MLITFGNSGFRVIDNSSAYRAGTVNGDNSGIRFHIINTPTITTTIIGYKNFIEEALEIHATSSFSEWEHSLNTLTNPGSFIIYDNSNKIVVANSDQLGVIPVFWSLNNDELILATNASLIAETMKPDPDHVGIIEFMRFGYSIGSRTFFKNVQRLMAGEQLIIDTKNCTNRSTDTSSLWKGEALKLSSNKIVDLSCERLLSSCSNMNSSMIMMSAGWDSRTVLAGALARGDISDLLLYNHGDIESRETRIVKAIGKRFNIQTLINPIEAEMFSPEKLEAEAQLFNNVIFPHWHAASHEAKAHQKNSVTAGIYGEIFGGHYGPLMLANGQRKISLLLQHLLFPSTLKSANTSIDSAKSEAFNYLEESAYTKPWYMKADYWAAHYRDIHNAVNADIEFMLSRYAARGILTAGAMIEAFITEHRGSQYIAAQLHSSSTRTSFIAPFADRQFVEFASLIPFALKVHNTLNRLIIQRLEPRLLEYPLAATLCNASRPIAAQEASRLVRKAFEDGQWLAHKMSRGALPSPHFGWVNYQFMSKSSALQNVAQSLKAEFWDTEEILKSINDSMLLSMHPLTDMLLKMKTTDFCLM